MVLLAFHCITYLNVTIKKIPLQTGTENETTFMNYSQVILLTNSYCFNFQETSAEELAIEILRILKEKAKVL